MQEHQSLSFLSVRRLASVTALLVGLAVTLPAHAHSVWIEDLPDGRLIVRFAEPGEDFETSPGHLDSLSLPVAWAFDSEGKPEPFEVRKATDHFLLVGAGRGTAAFGETAFPVMRHGDNPATRPFFAMRWLPAGPASAAASPALTLDIVPTGEAGAFRLCFRGEPVAGAQVTVRAPDGERELTADAQGVIHVMNQMTGLYLLTANQREPAKGFAGGSAFDRRSYNVALTWRQP